MKHRTMLERNDHVLKSAARVVENMGKVLIVVLGTIVLIAQAWHWYH